MPNVNGVTGRIVGTLAMNGPARAADVGQVTDANTSLDEMLKQQVKNGAPPQGVDPNEVASLVGGQGSGESPAIKLAADLKKDSLMQSTKVKLTGGDWQGALRDLNSILMQDPTNVAAMTRRAEALNQLKLYGDAERDARKAIGGDQKNPAAWQQLAWSLLKQKRYKEALEAINRSLQLDANNATSLAIRSYIKEALGDHDGAMQDLERAALLDARYRDKLQLSKQGAKIYDPDEDTMAHTVANQKGRGHRPVWPYVAAFGAFLLLSLVGGLSASRPGPSRRQQEAMIAQRPSAPDFVAQEGGQVIGKYELGRVIGKGGMGEVYAGKDLSLGRPVAIKKMSAQVSELGAQGRQALIKEARMVAALHHPAIVDIYEIIEQGSDLYLIFELVKGKPVHHLLAESGGRLPVSRALEILRPVCQALQFAHEQGLVHRDLKPANIMVTDQGNVKLMDFGIARSVGDATVGAAAASGGPAPQFGRTQMVMGTPSYMSPETGEGVVCKEADIYSLGVTLYEMLTGRLPFDAEATVMDKMAMKCAAPTAVAPDLPKAVDDLVGLALQPKPEHRIKTPADFLARLEAIAAAGRVPA